MKKDLFLRYGTLFLLWLGFSLTLVAQNQVTDSLAEYPKYSVEDTARVSRLNRLAFELSEIQPDSTISLARSALDLATRLGYLKGQGISLQNIGIGNYRLGNYKEAILSLHRSIELCEHVGCPDCASTSMLFLGSVYYDRRQSGFTVLQQPMVRNGLITGAILLSLLTFGLYRSFKLKREAYELLKKKNQELSDLSLYKENLTHMIAHDMKNPLNAVIALSQGESTAKKLETINQSGQQMLSMIANMLEVQKFQEAEMVLNEDTYNFRDLFYEALTPLNVVLTNKRITIEKSFKKDLFLYVDRQRMVRVISNLISNAVNFSKRGGVIEVSASEQRDGWSTFTIKDYGRGISKKQLDHVFEKYWQDENSGISIKGSTGLGLTFCKLAVEAHGGTITVASEPNQYTVFSVTLKTADPSRENHKEAESVTNAILILKNERSVLRKYFHEFNNVKVFEVGKISKIIQAMEKEGVKSPWKGNLVAAMHKGDQVRFDELIRLLK